jgi:hypothetical protein
MDHYTVSPGSQLTVPVKAVNFTDIASMSLSILYDSAVLHCTGNIAHDSLLDMGMYVSNVGIHGIALVGWFSLIPVTLADTGILATFQFDYVAGSTALVFDTLSSGGVGYSNVMGSSPYSVFINGSVNQPATNPVCAGSFTYSETGDYGIIFNGSVVNNSTTYAYLWDYGDGATNWGTQNTSYHVYADTGNYIVTMEAWGLNFCISVYSDTITVVPNHVDGSVSALTLLDTGYVEFFHFDTTALNFVLYDSVQINSDFSFQGIADGHYILRATAGPSSIYAANYLPTYYGNTPFWNLADFIYSNNLQNPYLIQLVPVTPMAPGPGTVGGTVTAAAKLMSSGPPMAGVEILLTDLNDEVLAITYSDSNGEFHFNDLAYGTYQLRAEITSIWVNPYTFTLSAANPDLLSFQIWVSPSGITVNIPETLAHQGFQMESIFPNPARDNISFFVSGIPGTQVRIEIFNQLGQLLISEREFTVNDHSLLEIDTHSLRAGIYCLSVVTPDGHIQKQSFSICR